MLRGGQLICIPVIPAGSILFRNARFPIGQGGLTCAQPIVKVPAVAEPHERNLSFITPLNSGFTLTGQGRFAAALHGRHPRRQVRTGRIAPKIIAAGPENTQGLRCGNRPAIRRATINAAMASGRIARKRPKVAIAT
jgi:hypothetical protein